MKYQCIRKQMKWLRLGIEKKYWTTYIYDNTQSVQHTLLYILPYNKAKACP